MSAGEVVILGAENGNLSRVVAPSRTPLRELTARSVDTRTNGDSESPLPSIPPGFGLDVRPSGLDLCDVSFSLGLNHP